MENVVITLKTKKLTKVYGYLINKRKSIVVDESGKKIDNILSYVRLGCYLKLNFGRVKYN